MKQRLRRHLYLSSRPRWQRRRRNPPIPPLPRSDTAAVQRPYAHTQRVPVDVATERVERADERHARIAIRIECHAQGARAVGASADTTVLRAVLRRFADVANVVAAHRGACAAVDGAVGAVLAAFTAVVAAHGRTGATVGRATAAGLTRVAVVVAAARLAGAAIERAVVTRLRRGIAGLIAATSAGAVTRARLTRLGGVHRTGHRRPDRRWWSWWWYPRRHRRCRRHHLPRNRSR